MDHFAIITIVPIVAFILLHCVIKPNSRFLKHVLINIILTIILLVSLFFCISMANKDYFQNHYDNRFLLILGADILFLILFHFLKDKKPPFSFYVCSFIWSFIPIYVFLHIISDIFHKLNI